MTFKHTCALALSLALMAGPAGLDLTSIAARPADSAEDHVLLMAQPAQEQAGERAEEARAGHEKQAQENKQTRENKQARVKETRDEKRARKEAQKLHAAFAQRQARQQATLRDLLGEQRPGFWQRLFAWRKAPKTDVAPLQAEAARPAEGKPLPIAVDPDLAPSPEARPEVLEKPLSRGVVSGASPAQSPPQLIRAVQAKASQENLNQNKAGAVDEAPAEAAIHLMMTAGEPKDDERPNELKPARRQVAAAAASTPVLTPVGRDVRVLKSGVSSTINEIDVTLNKAVVLNLSRPAARVSISDPTIASVLVISPTQIQLIGNQVGVANLLVWGDAASTEHSVVDINVHRDVSVLARQMKFVDAGIHVVPLAAEDTVILSGEAESREAVQLAVDLARAFFKGGTGAAGGGAAGAGGAAARVSSASAGSAYTAQAPNIINLITVKGQPSTKMEMARQKLAEIDPNIKLDIVPADDGTEKAILTGRVRSASMISRAINTAGVFYGQPGIKVLTGPGGNGVRQTPGDPNFPTDSAFSDNHDINVLQGTVMTDTTGNVVSMLEVSQRPQIKCSIQFIEVSKSSLDALGGALYGVNNGRYGFAHASGIQSPAPGKSIATVDTDDSGASYLSQSARSAAAAATRSLNFATGFSQTFQDGITQAISINNRFSAVLSALEERRKARTLAEPNITMLSGEKATFLAGGEVPIPVIGGNGQVNVTYHEFGIKLNLIPTYLDNGKINMIVAPQISSIDPTNGVSTSTVVVPGFRTRRMQTTLELENGQAFVLAGLYSQDEIYSISRFPWAGRLPIIGAALRNKWKNSNKSELIVIIRPEVVMLDADSNRPYNPYQPGVQPQTTGSLPAAPAPNAPGWAAQVSRNPAGPSAATP